MSGLCGFLVLCVFAAMGNAAEGPKREILGVNLTMPKSEVLERLKALGKFERDESKRQQIWKIEDESFSHVIVGFDKEDRLRFITAVAREGEGAKGVGYGDVGELKTAKQAGNEEIKNFVYEWQLPAAGKDPAAVVYARGRDPKLLSTWTLKRLGQEADETEKD